MVGLGTNPNVSGKLPVTMLHDDGLSRYKIRPHWLVKLRVLVRVWVSNATPQVVYQ